MDLPNAAHFTPPPKLPPDSVDKTLYTPESIILTQKTQVFKNLKSVFKGCSVRKVENHWLSLINGKKQYCFPLTGSLLHKKIPKSEHKN